MPELPDATFLLTNFMPDTQDPPSTAGMSMADAIAASPEAAAFFNNPPANINVPPAAPVVPAAPVAPKAPAAPATPAAPAAPVTPKPPGIPPLRPPTPAAPPANDDDTIIPESIKSTKAADDWRKIHNEARTLRQQNAELSKMVETRSKAPPEVESLKKQNHELSEQLRVLDVERHPQFQQYFGNKTAAAIATARAAVGVDKAEEMTRVLQLPESDYRSDQIDAMIAELPTSRHARVMSAVMELDRINVERTAAITRAQQDRTALDGTKAKEQEARQAQVSKIFDATLQEAQENLPAFQEREGDDAWNAQVQERIATARHIFSGNMPFEDVARATMWASAAPAIMESAAQLAEENKALKAENAALRTATPSPGGGGGETITPDDPNASYIERVSRAAEATGAFAGRGGR